jgi:NAD(P)-dependent dehydrogenase (short-subunit alcohol dehydrogenase family)
MVSFDVGGRRVLIIGASSGIGYVLAREFTDAGADVTIVAEVAEIHDAATRLAEECGRPVRGILCDITDRSAVASLADEVGRIDVLVNNAAIAAETAVTDGSEETAEVFRRTLDVNVSGLYWVTQALVGSMRAGGRIIFTSSLWGKTAGPRFGAYVASKHAVIGLVRTLAMELGPREINVNAVCPHGVRTELNLRVMSPEMLEKITSLMWLRPGLIPPEDIAGVYLFLASPAASEITGQAISVDRGASPF